MVLQITTLIPHTQSAY